MINIQWWIGFFILCGIALFGFYLPSEQTPRLSSELAKRMGVQIWQNECAGKKEGLTSWNLGEEFASLGIGHFIWYPEGKKGVFTESFPSLLTFFKRHRVQLPAWLNQSKGCPWQTREEFQLAFHQPRQEELRDLLVKHIDLQILFMVLRLNKALPTLLKYAPKSEHRHLRFQFYRLTHTPGGIFALLDYINFKGEGINLHESYNGHGWGLLQVLTKMHGTAAGAPAVEEFVRAAKETLSRRVDYSPPERGEKRWLKGWYNRLDGYLEFSKNFRN